VSRPILSAVSPEVDATPAAVRPRGSFFDIAEAQTGSDDGFVLDSQIKKLRGPTFRKTPSHLLRCRAASIYRWCRVTGRAVGDHVPMYFCRNGLLRRGDVEAVRVFSGTRCTCREVVDAREKFCPRWQASLTPSKKTKNHRAKFMKSFEPKQRYCGARYWHRERSIQTSSSRCSFKGPSGGASRVTTTFVVCLEGEPIASRAGRGSSKDTKVRLLVQNSDSRSPLSSPTISRLRVWRWHRRRSPAERWEFCAKTIAFGRRRDPTAAGYEPPSVASVRRVLPVSSRWTRLFVMGDAGPDLRRTSAVRRVGLHRRNDADRDAPPIRG